MVGLARALGVSVGDIVIVNLIYQIEDIGVTCDRRNTTGPCPPGICTGAVVNGQGASSGEVWQGRNLDWNLDASLLQYTLHVDYQRDNKTVFSGVQIAGQVGVLHGMRFGGFSAQLNARNQGGNVLSNLFEQILLGGRCPSHTLRYALENKVDFSTAETFLSSERLANPVYYVMAGIAHGEGVILSRDRARLVDAWHLFETPDKDKQQINIQPDWFRLQTNYDHWEVVPSYDDRRGPGVAHIKQYCSKEVDAPCMDKVMRAWPTKNHHTDVTSIMCPSTGFFDTVIWTDPTFATLV
jgi:N-acylethanolamine-hydrolysing acid amidase